MSKDILEGITKEVEEVEYKGIDLTQWLEEKEEVEQYRVEAYRSFPQSAKTFDLSDVSYIDIITYDEEEEVVHNESRWDVSEGSIEAVFEITKLSNDNKVTENIIVGENVGADSPDKWIEKIERGRYRVGVKNGEVGATYRVTLTFETDANRNKRVHFPVNIIDVTNVL